MLIANSFVLSHDADQRTNLYYIILHFYTRKINFYSVPQYIKVQK